MPMSLCAWIRLRKDTYIRIYMYKRGFSDACSGISGKRAHSSSIHMCHGAVVSGADDDKCVDA